MDRRELFGTLTALGAVPVCAAAAEARADHGADAKHDGPLGAKHFHFCGIHMAKADAKRQFVTQHYCAGHPRGDAGAVFQCVLFDGTGADAKLVGVEYIISDEAYRKLPDAEKAFWHAHTYEVLGGGLIAPNMPADDEKKFMSAILTTWGKAWHTWPDTTTNVPVGEPLLIWSLMADGQADPKVVAQRDKDFKVETDKIAAARQKEFGMEKPNVALPKDMKAVGRQWTNDGDDKPRKK